FEITFVKTQQVEGKSCNFLCYPSIRTHPIGQQSSMEASTRYPLFQHPSPPQRHHNHHHRRLIFRHHGGVCHQSTMRFQNLQRLTTTININPIRCSLTNTNYLNFRFDSNLNNAMDDVEAKNKINSDVDKDAEETKKSPEIPSPPEKPLAGDCCGSGCVREKRK
ncbi:hypothetical protein M8C21_002939, partial [Ambrosia artemisiifolia]